MVKICRERCDSLGDAVLSRLQTSVSDLVSVEARYHKNCFTSITRVNVKSTCGRPLDNDKLHAFDQLCDWLESTDCDLLTLEELIEKSKSFTDIKAAYSEKYLKCKLQERYGNRIFFAEVNGRRNVICWRNMALFIVNEKWYADRRDNVEDDAKRVVVAAAKLIRAEIKESGCFTTDVYPTADSINDIQKLEAWIPT